MSKSCNFSGRHRRLLCAAVDVILQMLAGSAWLCYSCWGDGHGTGSVYILPREHLVFIRLFKNPPQPLRPDWRVACIGAHCLTAGHRSEYTHTHTYNLIFPHKDNRAVAAGLLCFFLHKNTASSFLQQRCFNPPWMETQRELFPPNAPYVLPLTVVFTFDRYSQQVYVLQ